MMVGCILALKNKHAGLGGELLWGVKFYAYNVKGVLFKRIEFRVNRRATSWWPGNGGTGLKPECGY